MEIKTGRGNDARALRALREALPDVEAARAWIVDQASGIERLAPTTARGGFDALRDGTP